VNSRLRLAAALFLAGTCTPLTAQTAPAAASAEAPRRYATEHRGTFNGKTIRYDAIVAETILKGSDGAATASIFTTSYVAKDAGGTQRPVLFMFNGGPGSPSLWLHMGAFGPKRVALPRDPAAPIPADAPLVDNPYTVLDVADVVLIDPPGTGFSRILPGAKPGSFYQILRDGEAVGEAIARWLTDHGRTDSPKYLLGESYGTMRVAAIAKTLLARPTPIAFDGLMILGQALNMSETANRKQNILSPVVALPTEAAIAWYHRTADRKGRSLDQVIAEARAYALGPYLSALAQGNRLPEAERQAVAAKLSGFTGLPTAYYLANDLILTKEALRTELIKGQSLGRYDARYIAPAQAGKDVDPSYEITPPYQARLQTYLRDTLKVPLDDYRLRDPDIRGWDYGFAPSPFSDWPYPQWILDAMTAQPKTRLMIGTGIYDLTTTIGAADYLRAQTPFPGGRVVSRDYPAGHMAYTDPDVLAALTSDTRAFILGTAK